MLALAGAAIAALEGVAIDAAGASGTRWHRTPAAADGRPSGTAIAGVSSQAVDFVRDVQPILRESCYGCHGPSQQMNGFRLDRRRDALRGGTQSVLAPGSADTSKLYLRLVGSTAGSQMPPTGPLAPDQIATIKAWIDQGAPWPDGASGEQAATPEDPAARRLIELLRDGDFRTFRIRLARDPRLASARGPGGATMVMFAAFYADALTLRDILIRGGDVNARNDAGATALMWAVTDAEKTRTLLELGANPNARSDEGRTPLMIAASVVGATDSVKLLIDRGADLNAAAFSLFGPATPLTYAALNGHEEAFRLMVAAGADLSKAGPATLGLALRSGCQSCVDLMLKAAPPPLLNGTMINSAPPGGPALATTLLLERGARADVRDVQGRTMLMLAAASDAMPVDVIKDLLARKIDVNHRSAKGETALMLARRHGRSTPVVNLLLEAGANDEPLPPAPSPAALGSARAALERTLPLLQKSDVTFLARTGCVSCHNNSLTAMTVAAARKRGVRVDGNVVRDQTKKIGDYLESWRERALQGSGIPGDADTVSYILLGLAAAGYPAGTTTDAHVEFLRRQQRNDGRWQILANRPPIESSDFEVTAASLRALQLYAAKAKRADYDRAIAAAAAWLRSAAPRVTEDRAFQLLGMHWTDTPKATIAEAGRALVAEQRADGGWAQIPTLDSDAYATGQALVALVESGAIDTRNQAYRRGVDFLLRTQLADGSWFVRSRAIGFQPLFNADFPHGPDAFISAAASNWAAWALALRPSGT
jgi:ankyrin repeat protein